MTMNETSVLSEELPQFVSVLSSLKDFVNDSSQHIGVLAKKMAQENNRENGFEFLEMKSHLFLEYLIDISYLMLIKVSGKSFADLPCIERLVRNRVILEKIRPINKKLFYQIDKLVKMTSADLIKGKAHPLSFKPCLENLVGKDEKDESENLTDEEEAKVQVYVPPRIRAVHYENGGDKTESGKKSQRRVDKHLLDELRAEYTDGPEIIQSRSNSKRARILEKEEERQRFEEDNMRRLTLTKKDKIMRQQANDIDSVINLGSFQNIGDGLSSEDESYQPQAKKKKGKFFAKKFKKRMQKRRK